MAYGEHPEVVVTKPGRHGAYRGRANVVNAAAGIDGRVGAIYGVTRRRRVSEPAPGGAPGNTLWHGIGIAKYDSPK